jgi:hypothetical protein
MNLLQILDEKLQGSVDIKTLLGENAQSLEGISFDDENTQKIKQSIFNQSEAESSPVIIGKVRDTENKAARKAVLDSIDSVITQHAQVLEVQPDNTKDKTKAILDYYKAQVDTLTNENALMAEKLKNGITDADSKAIIQEKDSEIKQMKLSYVPKDQVVLLQAELDKLKKTFIAKEDYDAMKNELKETKKKVEKLDKLTYEDQIVSKALTGNYLSEDIKSSELMDVTVLAAVNKYVDSEVFGSQGLKAVLKLNEVTRKLEVRQEQDVTLPISLDGKILTVEDVINKALVKYNIHSKGQRNIEVPFSTAKPTTFGTPNQFNEKAALKGFGF